MVLAEAKRQNECLVSVKVASFRALFTLLLWPVEEDYVGDGVEDDGVEEGADDAEDGDEPAEEEDDSDDADGEPCLMAVGINTKAMLGCCSSGPCPACRSFSGRHATDIMKGCSSQRLA